MTIKRGKHDETLVQVAKDNGWQRLSNSDVDVEMPLTDEEKAEAARKMMDHTIDVERLENQFADIKADYKNQIDGCRIEVKTAAKMLKKGTKLVSKKLPTFLDSKKGIKIFYDPESAEIVKEIEASDKDRQIALVQNPAA